MLVLGDNVTLSILHICRQHHRRHHYYHHSHHNHHHDHHHHHRQLGQPDRTVGIVALGPTMHKRPAVSDPSIVMLSRLDVRGRRQCHLETDLIMWSGPRQTALSVSPHNANPNDIETGVISNKESSLTVSLFKVEQLRLSRSSLDQGNCTASKRSSHLEKQLCWHQLFSCEMAIFGLTYCEDRFSPAIAQIMANVSHLVAINSSDDELVIILIKNTFPISSLHHMPSATV